MDNARITLEDHRAMTLPQGQASSHAQLVCRSCSHAGGQMILDLGMQPLANNFLHPEDEKAEEQKFSLKVFVCSQCWLMQLVDVVSPGKLFSDYLYFSSFSDTMLNHAKAAAERYRQEFNLDGNSFVLEAGSNDGYLLKNFKAAQVPYLGIEPASNIAQLANKQGIETRNDFFTLKLAQQLAAENRRADLILGNNVFAHAPATNDFVAGLREALKPSGRIVLEFPYAADFIENSEFDTVYYEHVYYFSLTALLPLFARHGLEIFHVERIAIHGGSLRLFAAHQSAHLVNKSVSDLLAEEQKRGLATLEYYRDFSARSEKIKDDLVALVRKLRAAGKTVAAYGAAAKGSTLLNYCGLGPDDISFVVDRSTFKQGRLMPGTHQPIAAPEQLAARRPDYALLLTWNFGEEILRQQEAYRAAGGKFIIPIPNVRVV